ncbi:hypothetical protein PV408_14810 [Streptomyces sp. ME18-1-4]|nr:hypothetical protein [Streptomyces sp. ME18-1-4]
MYALGLPGMGYSEIVPGASYDEPGMRAGVERLLTELDLHDVTLVGEPMGAVLADGAVNYRRHHPRSPPGRTWRGFWFAVHITQRGS